MRTALKASLAAACVCLVASPAEAESCWRARPSPACRFTVTTEAGPRLGTAEPWDPVGYAVAVGLVRSGPVGGWGYGAVVQATTSNESGTYMVALMPRIQRWLRPDLALEAGAGLGVLGPGTSAVGLKGASVTLGLNYRGLVSLVAGYDREFARTGIPMHQTASLGLRFGAWLAPPVLLTSVLVGARVGSGS